MMMMLCKREIFKAIIAMLPPEQAIVVFNFPLQRIVSMADVAHHYTQGKKKRIVLA